MPGIAEGAAGLATIDFEASCLPSYGRSFPVEVAACDVETTELKAWLIRPTSEWETWDWAPEAERRHGLTLAQLRTEGRDAREVLDELSGFVGARRVLCDSALDRLWLTTLADAAGASPPFMPEDINRLWADVTGRGNRLGWADVRQAQADAFLRFQTVHRAGPDAQRLAEAIRKLRRA